MRWEMSIRELRKLGEILLSEHGIPTAHPHSGRLYGEIRLKDTPFMVRINSIGRASIYNLNEGTLNKPIPVVEWVVPFGRGWVRNLAVLIAAHRKASSPKVRKTTAVVPNPGAGKTVIGPGGIPIPGLLYDPATGVFWRADGKALQLKAGNSLYVRGMVFSGNALNLAEAALRTCLGEVPGKPCAAFLVTSNRDYGQNPSAFALSNLRWDSKRQVVRANANIMRPVIRRWAEGVPLSTISREFGHLAHGHIKNIVEGIWGNQADAVREARYGYHIDLDPDRLRALRDREKAGIPDDFSAKVLRQVMANFPFPRGVKPKIEPKRITSVEAEAIFVAWEQGGSFNGIAKQVLESAAGSRSVQFLIEGSVSSGATVHEAYEHRRKVAVLNRAAAEHPKDDKNKSLQKLRARYGI